MDKEEIILIEKDGETVEYHFKLKSQVIVDLEALYGKNIFEIFETLSFTSMRTVLEKCRIKPEVMDKNIMMDDLLTKYSLIEIGNDLLQNIALKSGLIKKKDADDMLGKTDPNA